MNESEIQDLLTNLQNDSAKRRWGTIQKIAKLDTPDVRLVAALEKLAMNDSVKYVEDEALATLKMPKFQAVLHTLHQPPPAPAQPSTMPAPLVMHPVTTTAPQPSVAVNAPSPQVANMPINCSNCGFQNPVGVRLCENCGNMLLLI